MDANDGFDTLFRATSDSAVYREAVRASLAGLPEWLVPFSITNGELLARIAREVCVTANGMLLDLACGTGGCGIWVAERTGARLEGIDFAPSAIATATELARRLGGEGRARFRTAPATATGLADASIDGAMCLDALMFVDPVAAARELARVLKPGGRFVATAAESLVEPFLPTLVRDYRPVFETAGFRSLAHGPVPGRDVVQRTFYAALEERADRLRAELGGVAQTLLEEARAARERERDGDVRVRDVLYVAERAGA